MAPDDATRARLRAQLEGEMGTEAAGVLAEEFGRIHDGLDGIRSGLREVRSQLADVGHRFDLIDMRFESVRDQLSAELHRELGGIRQDMIANTRLLFFSAIGSTFTAAGLAFAAVRFG